MQKIVDQRNKNKKEPSIDTRLGVKCRGCKPPLSISKL